MEIKKYLPKRIKDRVKDITIELDFDNAKNRNVQHYFVTLDNEVQFDATSIRELVNKAKRIQ